MATKDTAKNTDKGKVKGEKPARLTRPTKTESDKGKVIDNDAGIEDAEDIEEDYLQQYQYGRELPLGDKRTNPTGGKALVMKTSLLSQPKVRVMIPVESGSDPTVPFDVTLNGYRLSLPRNQYIDVPQQIAEVIMNSHNQTQIALSHNRIDTASGGHSAKDKEDALS